MYISGITDLVFYKNVVGKKILLLGELHTQETCQKPKEEVIQVSDLMLDVAYNIPDSQVLDIFMEGTYKKVEPEESNFNIIITQKILDRWVKQNNPNNVRLHFIDPRTIPFPNERYITSPLVEGIRIILNNEELVDRFVENVTWIEVFDAISFMMGDVGNHNTAMMSKVLQNIQRILLERNIPTNISENLDDWMIGYFTVISKELDKLDTSIISRQTLRRNLRECYLEYIQEDAGDDDYMSCVVALSLLFAVPMDIYVLTRLFIRFAEKPGNRVNQREVKNVIIHSGTGHRRIYEKFFQKVFAVVPDLKLDSGGDETCLDIGEQEIDFWE